MNRFQAVVRFAIHADKGDEFKRIAEDMIRLTREKDTGTVRLDIFVNDDGSEAVFYEEFVSPEARLAHLANMGDNVAAMLAIGDMRADVWTMHEAGRSLVEQLLVISATEVAGGKHPGRRGGEIRWHGSQQGHIVMDERKLNVKRPRLRRRDGGEVPVPA